MSGSIWSKIESSLFKKYIHNPTFLSGPRWKQLEERSKLFKFWNNALNAAPAFKWGLSIIPLYGVFVGNPPVEKIDMNTSLALTVTGGVWAYYATLVKPRANSLLAVSIALFLVNGYNVARRINYDRNLKKVS